MRHSVGVTSSILLCFSAAMLWAQHSVPRPDGPGLRVDVRLVNVVTTVTDPSGRYVAGLTKDDFVVEEDGVRQDVAHFSHDSDIPVSVGILFDTSASMQGRLRTAELAIDHFTRVVHPNDDIFVMTFAGSIDLRQDFTDDRDQLARSLRSINATGATLLYDALIEGLSKVKSGRHDKQALLLITDGQDTGSVAALNDVLQRVRQSEVLIYPLGVSSLRSTNGRPDTVDMKVLEKLAAASGGRPFMISDVLIGNGSLLIDRTLSQIADELRSQYTLAFYPSHSDDGRFHNLHVRTRNGLIVRSRNGYMSP